MIYRNPIQVRHRGSFDRVKGDLASDRSMTRMDLRPDVGFLCPVSDKSMGFKDSSYVGR